MKSQPLAYNKDNQEDKEPLIDSIKTVSDCLRAFGGHAAKRDSLNQKQCAPLRPVASRRQQI